MVFLSKNILSGMWAKSHNTKITNENPKVKRAKNGFGLRASDFGFMSTTFGGDHGVTALIFVIQT